MATAVSAAAAPPSTSSAASPTIAIVKEQAPKVTEEQPVIETKVLASHENEDPSDTDPLSSDLRRILSEVARTGRCPWLTWNGEEVPDSAKLFSETNRPHVSSSSKPTTASLAVSGKRPVVAKRRTPSAYRAGSPMNSASKNRRKNGLHVTARRRFSSENGTNKSVAAGTAGRKRPLFLLRTPSSSTTSVASIGSGRTSGSEPEGWDSEGTSATTNSELSMGERKDQRLRLATLQSISTTTSTPQTSKTSTLGYKTLREAFRVSLGLVLDHSYRFYGGYKLSPAEIRINEAAFAALNAGVKHQSENGATSGQGAAVKVQAPSAEKTFFQRRKRLLARLGDEGALLSSSTTPGDVHSPDKQKVNGGKTAAADTEIDGPPFTIQRIAEVLIAPERYYKQTHKLCNCLEKLLLVTSPASAFGGAMGGGSLLSSSEGQELSALADERGYHSAEPRKRVRRQMSSSSDETPFEHAKKDASSPGRTARKQPSPENSGEAVKDAPGVSNGHSALEAAAKASLRHKFENIGHDPHGAVDRDARGPNRGMTSSPPPPSLGLPGPATMPGHGFVRHLSDHPPGVGESSPEALGHHSHLARPPSPILFSAGSDPSSPNSLTAPIHPSHNMHLLQMHHAAAMAGVPLGSAPLNFVIDPATGSGRPATQVAELEVEPGRSSASNSDIDSESDDFSLDDSASDRSDGSDFDSVAPTHYEPFTAARVMALNRMQQQQRLQSRAGTFQTHSGDGFRRSLAEHSDSGDSIDSTLAEDSGGSDSSSSDIAD